MFLKKQKLAIILLVAFLAIPVFAHAFNITDPLVRCGRQGQNPCTIVDFFAQVAYLTNWLIAIAVLFFVQRIVNHGFWLVITLGNEEVITKHRAGLMNAVLGFILVLMAFMMVNTAVNFLLGVGQCKTKLDLTNPLNYVIINDKLVQCRGGAQ